MSDKQDKEMYDIGSYGVPRNFTACPGCGKQFGHHKTKVCMNCEQCSKCCTCKEEEKDWQDVEKVIGTIIDWSM